MLQVRRIIHSSHARPALTQFKSYADTAKEPQQRKAPARKPQTSTAPKTTKRHRYFDISQKGIKRPKHTVNIQCSPFHTLLMFMYQAHRFGIYKWLPTPRLPSHWEPHWEEKKQFLKNTKEVTICFTRTGRAHGHAGAR